MGDSPVLWLERHDAVRNLMRFYALRVTLGLFGQWGLLRVGGRVGCKGQMRTAWFRTKEEAEIARATLEVLNDDPQRSPAMIALLNRPPPQRFGADLLSAGLLVAVVFLLRAHLRFEDKARSLVFTIEHKPGDSQRLSALLNKLSTLLPTANRG